MRVSIAALQLKRRATLPAGGADVALVVATRYLSHIDDLLGEVMDIITGPRPTDAERRRLDIRL